MKRRTLILLLYTIASVGTGWVYLQRNRQQVVVLERIDTLQNYLAADCRLTDRGMIYSLRSLQKAVWDNRKQVRDVAVRIEGERIVARTQSLVDSIRSWRQQLQLQANDSIAQLTKTAHTDERAAQHLAQHLNRYAGFLTRYIPRTAAQQLEIRYETGWPFASQAPVVSAMASLTILETQIQQLASEALVRQVEKVGSCAVRFEKSALVAVPASRVVAPGANYESLLFFAKGRGGYLLRMTVDGKPTLVKDKALSQVEFAVPPLQPGQPDTVRARWRGIIEGQTYRGDTTWRLEVPYLIVKRPAL
jgi:hypothetical protein